MHHCAVGRFLVFEAARWPGVQSSVAESSSRSMYVCSCWRFFKDVSKLQVYQQICMYNLFFFSERWQYKLFHALSDPILTCLYWRVCLFVFVRLLAWTDMNIKLSLQACQARQNIQGNKYTQLLPPSFLSPVPPQYSRQVFCLWGRGALAPGQLGQAYRAQ